MASETTQSVLMTALFLILLVGASIALEGCGVSDDGDDVTGKGAYSRPTKYAKPSMDTNYESIPPEPELAPLVPTCAQKRNDCSNKCKPGDIGYACRMNCANLPCNT